MIDFEGLRREFNSPGSKDWIEKIVATSREKTADESHGNLPGWRDTLGQLPDVGQLALDLQSQTVVVELDWDDDLQRRSREELLKLIPWRKGPFNIGGIHIDTEWRSDLKWQRLENSITPLAGRAVLDVGCGNGYYALRMRGHGARIVLGVDPTLLFVVQFAALKHFIPRQPVFVLPLRLHELPSPALHFDTTFSMGVLYHQREPIEHLLQLKNTLRSGGELVLETLILPGDTSDVLVPEGRYARMRNVWHLPTAKRLTEWLEEAGFSDIRIIDQSHTTTAEQRTTEWMPFESLGEALDTADPARTIEGLPAPLRIITVCRNPNSATL